MPTRYFVVSDLHMAGRRELNDFDGPAARSFNSFLDGIENDSVMVFNGDTFDFAQTPGDDEWEALHKRCFRPISIKGRTASDSNKALDYIFELHKETIEKIAKLTRDRVKLWFIAGNHDPDLLFPEVRSVLKERLERLGGIKENIFFSHELVLSPKYPNYGAVRIFHGHQEEGSENRYKRWPEPFVGAEKDRLETSYGDRFVAVILNPVDMEFPYVDNILPIRRLFRAFMESNNFCKRRVATLLQQRFHATLAVGKTKELPITEDENDKFLVQNSNLDKLSESIYKYIENADTAIDAAMIYEYSKQTSGELVEKVSQFKDTAVSIAGHTHCRDAKLLSDSHRYFNTGTWIPYLKKSAEIDPEFHKLPLSAHAEFLPQFYTRTQDYLILDYDDEAGVVTTPKLESFPVIE